MNKKPDGAVYALLNIPVRETETTVVEVKRLKLRITLQELSYDKMQDLRAGQNADLNYLLSSIAAPNVRDPQWYQERMGCPTPVDALKRLLKPGEIAGLIKHADILNGYGFGSVSAVAMEVGQLQGQAVDKALEDLEKN